MDTKRLPKQALQYEPKGRRNIGRPRKRLRDQLHLEYQGTGNMPNPSGTWWWWWNCDIKLVSYSSTITMMHGPIYINFVLSSISRKSRCLWHNVEKKYGKAKEATEDSLSHAHCKLGTYGYKHTLRKYNTYCSSTAIMFKRRLLISTLYVNCLSCWDNKMIYFLQLLSF